MYRGLFDLPALQSRTRAATDQTAADDISNIDDPFRVMKADQAEQAGQSEWAPFFQSLTEAAGGKKMRISGLDDRASMRGLDPQQYAPYFDQAAQLGGIRNK